MITTDPVTAWVTASRHEELDAWRAMYDTLHPAPSPQTRGGGLTPGFSAPRRAPSSAVEPSNGPLHPQPPAGRDALQDAPVTRAPRRAVINDLIFVFPVWLFGWLFTAAMACAGFAVACALLVLGAGPARWES